MRIFAITSPWKKRHIPYSLLLIPLLGFFFSACVKENNYSIIPAITYRSFTPFCSGSTTDSAYMQINFTDGDGDIGYPAQDASAQPDFFANELIYENGVYKSYGFGGNDSTIFSYHIPNITPSGKDKSLDGIIQINFEGALQTNQTLQSTAPTGFNYLQIEFQVWIYDRAGHKSNVITTPPLTICQ